MHRLAKESGLWKACEVVAPVLSERGRWAKALLKTCSRCQWWLMLMEQVDGSMFFDDFLCGACGSVRVIE